MYAALFGNGVAEMCILYIVNYGEGHIRGIAATCGLHVRSVQLQLEKLEAGGILVNQMAGNTKLFKINPRLPIKAELIALANKILSLFPEDEVEQYFRQRRRPRRTGKDRLP